VNRFRTFSIDFWIVALALFSLLVCFFYPTWTQQQNTYRYVFILDITQSMNTRDYTISGFPPDRLSFAKKSLQQAIKHLPCGSETGIGLFTTKDSMILIEPVEICSHYSVIDEMISHIDWRMAWAADSNIERGLYSAILTLRKWQDHTNLVFFTDGEQSIKELHRPPLSKHFAAVKGFIIGVGGTHPSPIPKLDKDNQVIDYWKNEEVTNVDFTTATNQPPKLDPKMNYLSSLQESALITLANTTGLMYRRLQSARQLGQILNAKNLAVSMPVSTDIRWIFALMTLWFLLWVWFRRVIGV